MIADVLRWPARRWWVTLGGAAVFAAAIGLPTGMVISETMPETR
jgi:hypothetical protein